MTIRTLITKIISKSFGHLSFLIMCAGSGALFISNILAKNLLTPQDYLSLSYLITITTILSSFALGGMEQLIVRYGTYSDKKLTIDKTSFICIIAAMTIALIASPITIRAIFPNSLNAAWIFFLTFCFCLSLINYNIFRISSKFIKAQISSNAWKFALLLGVIICIFGTIDSFQNILLTCIAVTGILNIYLSAKHFNSLTVISTKTSTLSTGLAFSFSLAIMTVLGTFDRVLAERLSGASLFAEYVYFSMIIIYPFNMIASYIGFKEAVFFKTNFSSSLIKQKSWNVLVKITILFLLFGGSLYIVSPLINLNVTWLNMLLSYALVCTKCIYSIFSSVMGSRASAGEIWKANLYSAAAIVITIGVYSASNYETSIDSLLALFIILWASRSAIFITMVLSKKNA